MAKLEYSAADDVINSISALAEGVQRNVIREVVMAGAEEMVKLEKASIEANKHVESGSMRDNVRPGRYYEDVGGGHVFVYPQGADGRGIDNARKAFIINYGRGGRRTAKTGDRFITKLEKTAADPVRTAMAKKFDECMKQYTK